MCATLVFSLVTSGCDQSVWGWTGLTTPPPVVAVSAYPATVDRGEPTTIGWSASNANDCVASGAWAGARPTSGSEAKTLDSPAVLTMTCTGRGGSAAQSASVAIGSPESPSIFPLHTEPGKRYLVDRQGRPFFIHGDTPWSLVTQPTREQAERYLEDRSKKGFNALLIELIESHFSAHAPKNVYGEGPFTVRGDFSTPNEAYFAHAEFIVSRAAAHGMLVMFTPDYMGYEGGNEGWYQTIARNGPEKMRSYGRYLANRFRAYDNIMWVQGGDYDPPEKLLVRALADGIRDIDTRWLQTYHGGRGTAALQFFGTSESWLTTNTIYTNERTIVASALREYARSTMPFFLIESRYEGEGATAAMIRGQVYQTALSGGVGFMTGDKPLWNFDAGWEAALDTPGMPSLEHFRAFVASIPWWTLEPDAEQLLLRDGIGSGLTRAAAAKTRDGSLAIVYTPTGQPVTVDLQQLASGNVTARWFDPASGAYVGPSEGVEKSAHVFTPPRRDTDEDWVLVLRAE